MVKPDVFLEPQINVTEGRETLAIPCAADGIPSPTITWSVAQVNILFLEASDIVPLRFMMLRYRSLIFMLLGHVRALFE